MKRKSILFGGIFGFAVLTGLLLGAVLFWTPGPADLSTAQTADPEPATQFNLEGAIVQTGDGIPAIWQIDVYRIDVVSTTQIITNGLTAKKDVWAVVEGVKISDPAEMRATTISLEEAPDSALFDRISSVDGNTVWYVGDTQVLLSPTTIITGPVEVGYLALVKGKRTNQALKATSIEVMENDYQVVLDGAIETLTGTNWWVDSIPVDVSGATIDGSPVEGKRVQITGIEDAPRKVRAYHVWVLDDALPAKLVGWLQAINDSRGVISWQVGILKDANVQSIHLMVDADTLIDDSQGPAQTGSWLDISAVPQTPVIYQAKQIRILPYPPKRKFNDIVEQMPPGGNQGAWTIGGHQVIVRAGGDIVVGAPITGTLVTVTGIPDHANIITAELIEPVVKEDP